ncbi:MAG: hypothetical protein AB7F65_05495 [Dehalococcoidia bacterium]
MDVRMFRWGRAALIPLAVTGALLVACSDEEGDASSEEATASAEATATGEATATTEATTEATATEAATEAAAEIVEVTAIDYGYEGLPETVKAGTKFTLVNSSEAELHEFVAILVPAAETRSAEELLALPEEELAALFGGEPAAVILAAPGTGADANIPAVGDGTVTEAGRYIVICAIPTGADPQAYLEAAAASGGQQPQVEGGAPHFVAGMFGEFTVE